MRAAIDELNRWCVQLVCRSAVRITGGALMACVLLFSPGTAAARSITLAWDPNPEPDVKGYVVYVGTEPGVYSERHDVGLVTSFVYSDALDNTRYYFSVAAYTADLLSGPGSAEVSSSSRTASNASAITYSAPVSGASLPAPTLTGADPSDPTQVCLNPTTHDCYTVRTLVRTPRSITGLAATPDERLFFIDDGRQIRVIAGGALSPDAALTVADPSRRLSGIAVGADFANTHFVYLGEIDALSDGSQELSVVRYRELRGVLGERAVIVAGLGVPPSGEGILTTDSAGRIYVALPSVGDLDRSTRYAYSGFILRFNADGTAASENRNASPILARGFDQPTAFAWGGETQLLATGRDVPSTWLARLDLAVPESRSLRALGAVPLTSGTEIPSPGNGVLLIDAASRVNRVQMTADGAAHLDVMTLPDVEGAIAIAGGAGSKTYVVGSPVAAAGLSILELTPTSLH